MKIPEKAPDWKKVLAQGIPPELAPSLHDLLRKANSDYLYWDHFKYLQGPDGIKPEQAWAMLKLSRIMQRRTIPLSDEKGLPFSYWLPDSILRDTHMIDQQASGLILVDDPLVHAEEKRRYMIRSLSEEAIASSQIEGAATTRAVAREMLRTGRKPKDHSERMIYNNYLSMQMVKEHIKEPLSFELITRVHARMTEDTLEESSWVGRFRTPQDDEVHVIDSDGQTVLYVPPKAEKVPALMKRLCDYINDDESDEFVNPVVKGLLLHFWVASVHPFMDGNGRTARALFYWYALKHEYWLFEYLSVSTTILRARQQYYRAFLYAETDDNDATYFIVHNLKAISAAMEDLNAYIARKQREKTAVRRLAINYPTLNARQSALLASALEKPLEVFLIEVHARVHGVTYQTSRTDLLGLKDLGLLKMHKEGKKFVFTPVENLREKMEKNGAARDTGL